MGIYSIKELERLSGVKAHTIRIWEQRYGLLKPSRTDTNIRFYDDQQLKKLLNISILNNSGLRISRISNLSNDQMRDALLKLQTRKLPEKLDEKVKRLIIAMIEIDESTFNEVIREVQQVIGFSETVKQLIYPLLVKVGIMWGMDEISPPQEHFVSNLIRQKIIAEIDKLPVSPPGEMEYVLFLPEDELHDIGLLLAHYHLRLRKHRAVYLGQNTPVDGILGVTEKSGAHTLLTFFIKTVPINYIQGYLERLAGIFQDKTILVAGRNDLLAQVELPASVRWLKSPDEL